jgi:hypothetical protein
VPDSERAITTPAYSIEWCENDHRVSHETMPDPFLHSTLHVQGWRNALRVLLHRYKATVVVGADPLTVERVLHLNPDYLPIRGPRRDEWNAQLQEALGAVGRRGV